MYYRMTPMLEPTQKGPRSPEGGKGALEESIGKLILYSPDVGGMLRRFSASHLLPKRGSISEEEGKHVNHYSPRRLFANATLDCTSRRTCRRCRPLEWCEKSASIHVLKGRGIKLRHRHTASALGHFVGFRLIVDELRRLVIFLCDPSRFP